MAAKKTLVAYATRYGSTREVAERVAAVLRDLGWSADVQSVENVKDLSGYSAVILGAPYYLGKMLKTGAAFLERHRGSLEALPVALFTLGPFSANEDLTAARGQMEKTLAELGWLKPVASEMFVGKYDPAVLRGVDRLLTKLKASPLHEVPAHDDRDWQAVDGWVRSLGAALRVAD